MYPPPDAASKVRMFKKLHEFVVGYFIVLCGYFNAYTDKKDRIPQQPLLNDERKKSTKMMSGKNDTKVFRVLYPNKTDFTRFDDIKIRIDHIYI